MPAHLIILGAPGSGKGTQAANLVKAFGYNHVSTGDLLRSEIAKGSDLGKKVSGIMSSGNLVNDEVVMELLLANCHVNSASYIFDGFPRNLAQAKMLDAQLLKNEKVKALYFNVNLDVLADRVSNRRVCSKCGAIYNLISKPSKVKDVCDNCGSSGTMLLRKDDNKEVVANRLSIFKETLDPMLEYYRAENLLVEIDATLSEEAIFRTVSENIK